MTRSIAGSPIHRFCALILSVSALAAIAISSPAVHAYVVPTIQTEQADRYTWQAGHDLVELLSEQTRTDCTAVGTCGEDFYQRILVTDLLTGKRVDHRFGCPQMPSDWSPHWAGLQHFTTSGDGKTFFAIFRTSNFPAQSLKNTSANSDPVCDEIVQWARTVGGSYIQSDYPGSPPGTKTMAGYAFLVRSDDGGSSWNLVPPPGPLKLISDSALPGGSEIGDHFTAYPTPNGIAFGSRASGVVIYDPTTRTWSDVQPIDQSLAYARPYFDVPPDFQPLSPSKKRAYANWRWTGSNQLMAWAQPRGDITNARNSFYWLNPEATKVAKRISFSPPRKRARLQNFSGSVVSMCAPRKLTARSTGLEDAWASDSGKTIWGLTSANVSIRCTTKNPNLWPHGRLVTDGIEQMLVRSKNGGRSWRTLGTGDLVRSGYKYATVVGNSLVALTKRCKRSDGSYGDKISRLSGSRWKSYGCV